MQKLSSNAEVIKNVESSKLRAALQQFCQLTGKRIEIIFQNPDKRGGVIQIDSKKVTLKDKLGIYASPNLLGNFLQDNQEICPLVVRRNSYDFPEAREIEKYLIDVSRVVLNGQADSSTTQIGEQAPLAEQTEYLQSALENLNQGILSDLAISQQLESTLRKQFSISAVLATALQKTDLSEQLEKLLKAAEKIEDFLNNSGIKAHIPTERQFHYERELRKRENLRDYHARQVDRNELMIVSRESRTAFSHNDLTSLLTRVENSKHFHQELPGSVNIILDSYSRIVHKVLKLKCRELKDSLPAEEVEITEFQGNLPDVYSHDHYKNRTHKLILRPNGQLIVRSPNSIHTYMTDLVLDTKLAATQCQFFAGNLGGLVPLLDQLESAIS